MRDGRWKKDRRAVRVAALILGVASLLAGIGAAERARAASAVLEVTPMVGWQWGGTLDYSAGGDVHVNAALNYGGALGVMLGPLEWGEVSYTYQSSELIGRPTAGPEFKVFDLGTHHIQLSGARYAMPPDEHRKANPYVMGGLGMTIFSPGKATVPVSPNTQYLFAISVGGGIRVALNEKLDLRLQSRMLLPMNFSEGSFYFGSGGAAVGLSGGTLLPQGEATLAITIKGGGSVHVSN
jgi:hypothetical protein